MKPLVIDNNGINSANNPAISAAQPPETQAPPSAKPSAGTKALPDMKDPSDPRSSPTSSVEPSPPDAAPAHTISLAALRLSQNFAADLGVKKKVVAVPVCKPNRQSWVRTHSTWFLDTLVLELKELRESYLIDKALWHDVPGEAVPKRLIPATTRQGGLFLWPIRLPGEDGRLDAWNEAALEAAKIATTKWIRIAANMPAGMYDVFEAGGDFGDAAWPDITFDEIVNLAFRGRYITSADHPVLRRLRGEA